MTWQRRIERAQELAQESPVLPELLDFYQKIARFQSAVAEGPSPANLEALLALIRGGTSDPMHTFFARVVLQAKAAPCSPRSLADPVCCPFCAEKPVAAMLRPEGDGARRFLLCGLCFTEWEYRRRGCPNCGEADTDKLRVHTDEEFPHIRVEACDTCRVYLKAIDLTRNGRAVPEVDELASVTLDLWAADQGYTKLQTNLFGM
jgi:formate dehydrogenase accessory protein FdhE